MILLLIIISVISAFFCAMLETDDLFYKKLKPNYKLNLIAVLPGIAVFIVYYNFRYSLVLLITSGIIITIFSFIGILQ